MLIAQLGTQRFDGDCPRGVQVLKHLLRDWHQSTAWNEKLQLWLALAGLDNKDHSRCGPKQSPKLMIGSAAITAQLWADAAPSACRASRLGGAVPCHPDADCRAAIREGSTAGLPLKYPHRIFFQQVHG